MHTHTSTLFGIHTRRVFPEILLHLIVLKRAFTE